MSGIIGLPNIKGSGKLGPPSGMVIQTVIKEVTGAQSTTQTSFTHFGDYDVNITPHFSNSIILITFTCAIHNSTDNGHVYVTAYRDKIGTDPPTNLGHSTQGIKLVSSGPTGGGKWHNMHFIVQDTGHNTINQITYKFYAKTSTGTAYINYSNNVPTIFMAEEISP